MLQAFLLGALAQSSLLIVALLAYRLSVKESIVGQMAASALALFSAPPRSNWFPRLRSHSTASN
ncbi:MAG: hypothetical protein NVV57_11110 [Demequina sp.]|nr:hypothetical protein [Demequina sp.]